MIEKIKSILFPQKCKVCFSLCEKDNLCDKCREKMNNHRCENIEKTGEKSIEFVDRLYSSYYYRGEAKEAVLNAKFKDMSSFINSFKNDIKNDILKITEENKIDIILSAPFYKAKLYRQEHDLPYVMADKISDITGIPHMQCVCKVRKTDSQHTLDKSQRKANLMNAFSVCGDVKNKTILIVDDVVTSGSTLLEIATELKLSECDRVIAYTYLFNEKLR